MIKAAERSSTILTVNQSDHTRSKRPFHSPTATPNPASLPPGWFLHGHIDITDKNSVMPKLTNVRTLVPASFSNPIDWSGVYVTSTLANFRSPFHFLPFAGVVCPSCFDRWGSIPYVEAAATGIPNPLTTLLLPNPQSLPVHFFVPFQGIEEVTP